MPASTPVVSAMRLMGLTCIRQQFAFTHSPCHSEPSSGKTRNLRATLSERQTGVGFRHRIPGMASKRRAEPSASHASNIPREKSQSQETQGLLSLLSFQLTGLDPHGIKYHTAVPFSKPLTPFPVNNLLSSDPVGRTMVRRNAPVLTFGTFECVT